MIRERSYLNNSGLCGNNSWGKSVYPPIPQYQYQGLVTPSDGILPTCVFTCAAGNNATVCAALGNLYTATNKNTQQWAYFKITGWNSASAGVPTDYCSFLGVNCTNNTITKLCVHCECTTALLLAK